MLKQLVLFGIFSVTSFGVFGSDTLSDDFSTFQQWLPGSYNNDKQYSAAFEDSDPHDQLAERLSISTDANIIDILGPLAIEKRMYQKGDMEKVYRHLLLTFEMDKTRNVIVQRSWRVKRKGISSADISKADLMPLPAGCETIWTRSGDTFNGITAKGDCKFPSYRHPGEFRLIESQHTLSNDSHGYMEWGYLMNGDLMFGRSDRALVIMDKVQD